MNDCQGGPYAFAAVGARTSQELDRTLADLLYLKTHRQDIAHRIWGQEVTFKLYHWQPHPAFENELGVFPAQTFVKPVFYQFMEEHEVLGEKHDPRWIAVLKTYKLFFMEHGLPHLS